MQVTSRYRFAAAHRGDEQGDDAGVRRVRPLPRAEDVEEAEPHCFEAIGRGEGLEVEFAGEFGRTPLGENRNGSSVITGRDHHPFAYSLWMAGGGVKGGLTYGETDEIGWNIARDPVDYHDFHATMLHLFGLEHLRLTHRFQGRDFRLTDVSGRVVREWIA